MTYPQAIAALKRAARVSRSVGGDRLRAIEARRERARFLLRTRRDIANMKDLIEREPANTSAREKLVRLYLVHLDDPAAAAKHLDGVEDEDLLKYVPAVGKGVESAPELACMELGDWYRRLGESAPTPAKRAMFERAKAYYERFLSLHEAADLKRITATPALKKVESLLADLIPPEATPAADATGGTTAGEAGTEDAEVPESGVIKPGTWVDLLPLVDPEKHTVKGTWKREGGRLAITDKVEQGRIVIPVMPSGSYRLHCEFVRASGTDAVYWQLPVGPSAVGLVVCGWGGAVRRPVPYQRQRTSGCPPWPLPHQDRPVLQRRHHGSLGG